MNPINISDELVENDYLSKRHKIGNLWKAIFQFSTLIGIIALATLLLSVLNQAFGYAAIENQIDPSSLASQPLSDLDQSELITILEANLSTARIRQLNAEKPLANRTTDDLYILVMERIVNPQIVQNWFLFDSIFHKDNIKAIVTTNYPSADLVFRSWLNWEFLTQTMSSKAELAGIRSALKGSLLLIFFTILFAFPVGVGAAIYLEEYTDHKNRINRIIQTNIDNLAGVPSIVYGILGLAIFVRSISYFTSGQFIGSGVDNGRTILSGSLTMGLLILPILIINAQEAIRAVPSSLRQASYGMGATRWQTIWHHVLPVAMPGILTGTILAISRAMGETAPLIVVGASTFISQDPSGPFSMFTALPIQIYNWTTRPQDQFRSVAAAAILVLLVALLSLNAIAIYFRNRLMKKL